MVDTNSTLRRLAARVAAIEKRLGPAKASAREAVPALDPRQYWLLEGLRRRANESSSRGRAGAGAVALGGMVQAEGSRHYRWQVERSVESLRAIEWGDFARAFGALGAPVRLELLRAVLLGVHDATRLARLPGMGTTGRLYHHLKELQAAGWLRQLQRNHYELVPDRVVVLLVVLAAVAGPEATNPSDRPRSRVRTRSRTSRPSDSRRRPR